MGVSFERIRLSFYRKMRANGNSRGDDEMDEKSKKRSNPDQTQQDDKDWGLEQGTWMPSVIFCGINPLNVLIILYIYPLGITTP